MNNIEHLNSFISYLNRILHFLQALIFSQVSIQFFCSLFQLFFLLFVYDSLIKCITFFLQSHAVSIATFEPLFLLVSLSLSLYSPS